MNNSTTLPPKVWFITGISRGFGKTLASILLARGAIVIGTTRDGTSDIDNASQHLHVLPLELTDANAISDTVRQAFALHGHIDFIVNNAGYGLLGSIEEATDEQVTHLFDVNFNGTRRVIQSALPYLRARRSGHIINITSIAGVAPGAGSGFYAASKCAVEGLSQSLAKELAPLGIHVTLVEPGAFRTDFLSANSIRNSENRVDDYADTVGVVVSKLASMEGKQPGDPTKGALAIIKAVESETPPLHLVLGPDALARTREVLAAFSAELDVWESVGSSTDFD
jgi:NAD(P)-dependent dehydrogenase (short-subunit alcohol dehydrogenase family)